MIFKRDLCKCKSKGELFLLHSLTFPCLLKVMTIIFLTNIVEDCVLVPPKQIKTFIPSSQKGHFRRKVYVDQWEITYETICKMQCIAKRWSNPNVHQQMNEWTKRDIYIWSNIIQSYRERKFLNILKLDEIVNPPPQILYDSTFIRFLE